jgi:hypothetical protein
VLNELPIPPGARSDKNAKELIRAWSAHEGLDCSLNVDRWGDEERTVWGILLTDVVRPVANALHDAKGWDKGETVEEIRRVFNAELDGPTADPSGQFHTH